MVIRVPEQRTFQGDYTALDDRMLVLDFQAGHPEAFVEIHKRYSALARHVCGKFLPNRQDADEALQETMIRVYQGLHRFNGQYALQPWIARIATNVSLDTIRTRARRPAVDDESFEQVDREDPSEGPDELVERLIQRDLVLSVLSDLPDTHRTALVLRELEGRSHKEIAEHMGISTAQAKALIHRAKGSFRREWLVKVTEKGGIAAFAVLPLIWALRMADVVKRVGERAGQAAQAAQVATPEIVTTAVSSASPTAVSVADRFVAAGMTILLAGGVTVGAVEIAKRHPSRDLVRAEAPVVATVAPAAPIFAEPTPEVTEPADRPREKEDRGEHADVEVPPVAVDPTPTEEPTPAPTEEPTPSPSEEPSPDPAVIPPAPGWTGQFAVDWTSEEHCGCGQGVTLANSASEGGLLEPGGSLAVTQTIQGAADDAEGDAAWFVDAQLHAELTGDAGTASLSFSLTDDVGKTHFLGSTSVTGVSGDLSAGEPLVYSFTGTYEAVGAQDDSPVPVSGQLQIQLAIWQDGSTAYIAGIHLLP